MLTAVIPGGCTKFIQAPDVVWNASFKSEIRKFHEHFMAHAEKHLTRGGNLAGPSMASYLLWVVDAWNSIPNELIAKSFKHCALTIAMDGLKDSGIHCFEPHGPIPSGLQVLRLDRDLGESPVAVSEIDIEGDESENSSTEDSIVRFKNEERDDTYPMVNSEPGFWRTFST